MRRLHLSFIVLSLVALPSYSLWAQTSASNSMVLVANKGDNSLGLIDPVAGKQVAEIPEGGVTGHEVTASPDGKLAYVPIYGNSGVGQPGTDGTNLVVIDLAARKVVGNIPTGQEQSHMFAITRDGRRAYTANVGPGTVSVLDLEARKTITIIPVSPQIQRISLSVDDSLIFTSDVTKPQMAVIDTATNKIKTWIPLPGLGYGSAPTPDGRWLVIALPLVHQVGVVDLSTMTVAHTIDVPARPQEVLVSPDNKVAYVSCDQSGKVAVISLSDWKVKTIIDAGPGADGLALAVAR